MNASRLLETASLIQKIEKDHKISETIDQLLSGVSNLSAQPNEVSYQSMVANSIAALEKIFLSIDASLTPAEKERIGALKGDEFLLENVGSTFGQTVRENAATLVIARDKISEFVTKRRSYFENIVALSTVMPKLGVSEYDLASGEFEIGFLLPRDLFDNKFDGLISELKAVNRIFQIFSEASSGKIEEVYVRQISTRDPIFFLSTGYQVILAIGGAVTWALNTWKQSEEIRNLRAQTAQLPQLKGSGIDEAYRTSIDKMIEASIEQKTEEILKGIVDSPRKNEQEAALKWALESILARVERGMTVELRLSPPKPLSVDENDENLELKSDVHRQSIALSQIAAELNFPRVSGKPMLEIPNLSEKE